jgi:FdhD protein
MIGQLPGFSGRGDPAMFRNIPCTRVDGPAMVREMHEVVEEIPIALFVNGRHAMTAMMSPERLEEFVTGYLFTEQMIKEPGEIESIRIEKNRISVITKNLFKVIGPKKTILSGCGGSTSFIDTGKLPRIPPGYTMSPAGISAAIKGVLDSDLHRLTGGIHVVGLVGEHGILTISEDIGRHNALDRVIGYGLIHAADFSRAAIVCSGRISSEMVRKCLLAGIPIIISRSATTTLAVEIADKTGITVIGFARSGKMNIYTHAERILNQSPP